MRKITVLIKPASDLCNMRCQYCFYKDVAAHRQQERSKLMSVKTADHLIEKAVNAVHPGGCVEFMFQGGEPTLAGLGFFRHFMQTEKKFAGIQFEHSIQTNGLLLDEQWTTFFKEYDFLVGVSVDGDEILHDCFRSDATGEGTYRRVIRNL